MFNHFPLEIFHDYFVTQQNRNAIVFWYSKQQPPFSLFNKLVFLYTSTSFRHFNLVNLLFRQENSQKTTMNLKPGQHFVF